MEHIDFGVVFLSFIVLLFSLTVHEAAHAWSADRLGDPTAKQLGRVSLNPAVHVDLFGTIILPLLAAISGLPIIGWAKPVPVSIRRLGHPRRDYVLVAAAGPASNLMLAVLASLLLRVIPLQPSVEFVLSLLLRALQINILLAVFNMVPIPPLDGGNVLGGLLPRNLSTAFDRLRPYGFLVLYGLMLTGVLSAIILPPAQFLLLLLIPQHIFMGIA